MSRIVIALGGNALGNNPKEQLEKIKKSLPFLTKLVKQGHEIIISHGNGPQVGMIEKGLNTAADIDSSIAHFELPECTAMSQGYIGFHIQNRLINQLRKEEISKNVATIITQVEVDKNDKAFLNPTKPIGKFYSEDEISYAIEKYPNNIYKEDSGRGYRQVVPSPKPIDIIEKDTILNLLKNNFLVIACGGGGIPVIRTINGDLESISSVIDKDLASAKLAELVDANELYILTAVDHVAINFGKSNQENLKTLTIEEAENYIINKEFGEGSMLPKIKASVEFVKNGRDRKAIITSIEEIKKMGNNLVGTVITR